MNTILVENDNVKVLNNKKISINKNTIDINEDCELFIEYKNDLEKTLTYNINNGVNVTLFIFSKESTLNLETIFNIYENSNLKVIKFYNNEKTTETTVINLNGYKSSIDYHFGSICNNTDNFHIIINHKNNNTYSNIISNTVTNNLASSNYIIDSYLPKNTKNCIIKQATKIITMKDNNSSIKPNMYIEEYDVEASHSSVIGKFNKDDIFYLQTRGISYEDSLKLLIKGLLIGSLDLNIKFKEKILKEINKYWR